MHSKQKAVEKLKPCPFCGSEKVTVEGYYNMYFFVACGCGVESKTMDSEQEAIKAWNRDKR